MGWWQEGGLVNGRGRPCPEAPFGGLLPCRLLSTCLVIAALDVFRYILICNHTAPHISGQPLYSVLLKPIPPDAQNDGDDAGDPSAGYRSQG
jgi:hypothetical protein